MGAWVVSWGQTRPLEQTRESSASASLPPSKESLVYRSDIDGLRALAVLPVVLFHFAFPGFTGGFVGVDIFFVISGYLITSLIVGDLYAGRFSFARFYERRIRRIIPALLVMLAAASIFAVALFPPKELADFGLSASAAAAFCSNFFFAFHTDYFSGTETLMPLLHTWSLGVEEQFYIVWPLMLFACYRLGSRLAVSALVVVLALTSLAYAEWGTTTKYAAQFFYLPQSRAWELMFGAILALGLVPRIGIRWLRETLGLAGIVMMPTRSRSSRRSHRFPDCGRPSPAWEQFSSFTRDSNATRRSMACSALSRSYLSGSSPTRSICGIGRSSPSARTMSGVPSPSRKVSV